MPHAGQTYEVGIARADVTPPVGIMLAGFAARHGPSDDVYDPLQAVAVAIDGGATPVLIVGADLLGFYDLTPHIRSGVSEATGIPEARIVLNGSHTHCGPCIRAVDVERHGPLDMGYVGRLVDTVVDVSTQAWEGRAPATLRFGVGACAFGTSRRKPDPDAPGLVLRAMQPYHEGTHDHEAPVLTVESPEGALRGILYSYACHPTSRGGTSIGGDYPGLAHDYIEQRHPGVIPCFLQGCGGDQKPRPPETGSGSFGQRTIEQVREIGDELGREVCEVAARDDLAPVRGAIQATQTVLTLGTEPLNVEHARQCLTDRREYVRNWAEHQLAMIERGTPVATEVPFEVQTIAFGTSLAVVTLAAEACVEHGLRLKRDLKPHFENVLVLGYSNAIAGYVPVKRQIPEGGYEVIDSNQYYKRTGPFVEGTEDRIHDAIHAALGLADGAGP